jgi:indole-3-glycerol phosphate synthase
VKPSPPPDLLLRLIEEARAQTASRRPIMPEDELEQLCVPSQRDFAAALKKPKLAVIAEMKARTPALGVLAGEDYSPARLAGDYERAGADAISVLCQEASFGGLPLHLAEARSATQLPILRKDFVVEEYQVLEARALHADSVLLIVAALDRRDLAKLLEISRRWAMEPLVEVHDEQELDAALETGARLVGVNHRDLRTFEIDISLTERLRPRAPADVVFVAESGIKTADDARRVRAAGADAVLVGEALMRADDVKAKIQELSVQ